MSLPVKLVFSSVDIEAGVADSKNGVLDEYTLHAFVVFDGWEQSKPYSTGQAFPPVSVLREGKFWPPVGRVDNW